MLPFISEQICCLNDTVVGYIYCSESLSIVSQFKIGFSEAPYLRVQAVHTCVNT